MWKIVSSQPPHSSCFLVTLSSMVVLLFFVATLPTFTHCLPLSNTGGSSSNVSPSSSSTADLPAVVDLAQLQSLFREAVKYMHKINSNTNTVITNNKKGGGNNGGSVPTETTRISGLVNLRYPRSGIEDVASRLNYLQEMDRKFGAKARPRFGKRNEVTQDNFIPLYGDEELKETTLGANGDGYPIPPPLIFIP